MLITQKRSVVPSFLFLYLQSLASTEEQTDHLLQRNAQRSGNADQFCLYLQSSWLWPSNTLLIKTYLLLLLQWFLTLYTDCSICIYSIGDHTLFLLCGTLREKSLNRLISLFKKEIKIVLQDFWHWSEQTPSVNHFDNDFLAAVSSKHRGRAVQHRLQPGWCCVSCCSIVSDIRSSVGLQRWSPCSSQLTHSSALTNLTACFSFLCPHCWPFFLLPFSLSAHTCQM